MPPKGRKRAATSQAGGPAKRSNADPIEPKCTAVCNGIGMAEALPETVKSMLVHNVRQSLNVFAADRHPYQEQVVQMLRETLATVRTELTSRVAEAQAKVDNADREKEARAARLKSAADNRTELEEKGSSAAEAAAAAAATVATAKANLAAAHAAFKDKGDEISAMSDQKAKLETVLKEVYEPLKTTKAGAKALNTLANVLKETNVEAGLVDCLPETFKKDPSVRRTFDALVAKHVEAQTARFITQTENALTDGERAKNDLAAARASAEAALAEAQQKHADSQALMRSTKEALKEGADTLKAADGAMSNFDQEMATAGRTLENAKSTLASFTEGALQSFEALKDLAEVEEPAAAEPEASEEVQASPTNAA